MESLEQGWNSFVSDPGKFFKDAANEATGGMSVKEVALYAITPIEDAELRKRNREYFQAELVMDSVCDGAKDWFKKLEEIDGALARFEKCFPDAASEFQGAHEKVGAARMALVNGRISEFIQEKFGELRKEHATIEPLQARATKLQYNVEQWSIVDGYNTPDYVSGFVKGKLETAQEELEVAKPGYFNALDKFLTKFAETKQQLLQVMREEIKRYDDAGEQAFAFGVTDPGDVVVDYADLDETLSVLKTKTRETPPE